MAQYIISSLISMQKLSFSDILKNLLRFFQEIHKHLLFDT